MSVWLNRRNTSQALTERQCDTLSLRSDPDVTLDCTVFRLFDRQIRQSVLAEETLGAQIRRQEVTIAVQRAFRGQASHVGRLHNVLQVGTQVASYAEE